MSRPQNQLPPDLYYNVVEASKYQSNTRVQTIQRQLAQRAIELLNLESGSYILDVGCGSGLSGQILTENEFIWQGIDISRDMLNIASQKQQCKGGLWQIDIGQGWRFRAGVFDGVISISTIQWLCVASKKSDNPFKRCCKFFQCLYQSMKMGGRAVLQFYPDGKHQLQMITSAAMKSGFSGGLVVDFPNSTRAKKYFLVIQAGIRRNLAIVERVGKTQQQEQNQQMQEDQDQVNMIKKKKKNRQSKNRKKIQNPKTTYIRKAAKIVQKRIQSQARQQIQWKKKKTQILSYLIVLLTILSKMLKGYLARKHFYCQFVIIQIIFVAMKKSQNRSQQQELSQFHKLNCQLISQNYSQYLNCPVCANLMVQPRRFHPCAHTTCINCLPKNKKKCPVCNSKCNAIQPDLLASKLIDQLQVKCGNKDCPYKGSLEDFKRFHSNKCHLSQGMDQWLKKLINVIDNKQKKQNIETHSNEQKGQKFQDNSQNFKSDKKQNIKRTFSECDDKYEFQKLENEILDSGLFKKQLKKIQMASQQQEKSQIKQSKLFQ